MSPLLFILIIESLSLIITDAQKKGKIKGIQRSPSLAMTHLFFVDDVILFGLGIVDKWHAYKEDLDLFCFATGMTVRLEKSSFLYNDVDARLGCTFLSYFLLKWIPLSWVSKIWATISNPWVSLN